MGYKVERLHNGTPATISISVRDKEWFQAYQMWLSGRPPTNSPEWKYGVIGETSIIHWYLCGDMEIVGVWNNRSILEKIIYNYAASYPGVSFSIDGMTTHEYEERIKYGHIKWSETINEAYSGLICPAPSHHHVLSVKLNVYNRMTRLDVTYEGSVFGLFSRNVE